LKNEKCYFKIIEDKNADKQNSIFLKNETITIVGLTGIEATDLSKIYVGLKIFIFFDEQKNPYEYSLMWDDNFLKAWNKEYFTKNDKQEAIKIDIIKNLYEKNVKLK